MGTGPRWGLHRKEAGRDTLLANTPHHGCHCSVMGKTTQLRKARCGLVSAMSGIMLSRSLTSLNPHTHPHEHIHIHAHAAHTYNTHLHTYTQTCTYT